MGLRTKAYFIGAYLTFFSSVAAALGLGEIKLNSFLNQPLDAEIQLLHVRDLTEREILIGIASPEEFQRAGVDRTYFVTDLQFAVDLKAAGGPVVKVTSRQPVREPFLNFIVTARWPSGKLLREYTLLVDLPVFTGTKAGPVQAASQPKAAERPDRSTSSTSQASERRRETAPVETRRPAETVSSFSSDTYGPVGANETLWTIASKARPDNSVSVQQTMLAIQRLNPEAFINGNINLLRRGQVLRIPDKEEIQKLTAREAIQKVAEQNRNWNRRATPAAEQAQLEGSRNVAPSRSEPAAVEGRVKLSTSTSGARTAQGAGADGGEGEAVAEALTQTQEELDAAGRENADLKSRIRAMEEQIETMERLVEVSSEEMRALELAAQQANEARSQTAEEVAETTSATQEEPKSEPAQVQTPPVQTQPAPIQPQKSWLDLAKENIVYIGAGLGALILGLIALIFLRKRNEAADDEFYDSYDGDTAADLNFEEDIRAEDDRTVPYISSSEIESEEPERTFAEAETEDVVGECDIHIAYGQYDLAEDKLVRALEKEPDNVAVRLKLLEVFAAQGDGERFDHHYATLRTIGTPEAIDRAAAMRESIEGIGEFDPAAHEVSDATVVKNRAQEETFDFGEEEVVPTDSLSDDTLDFDFNDVDELVDSSSAQNEGALDTLDFDLTLEGEETQDADSASLATDDFDLDISSDELRLQPEAGAEFADAETEFAEDSTEFADSNDLADLDFDLDTPEGEGKSDSDFDLDFADVDQITNADTAFADEAPADFDLDLDDQEEKLTTEFADDLVAERAAPKTEEDFEFSDVDLALTDDQAEANFADLDESLDFDLDGDLEQETALEDEPPVLSSDDQAEDENLSALELEDLQDLDFDSDVESESAVAKDFEDEFDFDKEVNLDELDHELDALASDIGADHMEEPVLDFDDSSSSTASEETTFAEDDGFSADDFLADENLEDLSAVDNEVAETQESELSPVDQESADSEADFEIPDFDPENDDDSNLDFLSDNDETATKLDLARAYIDMGDADGAKDILDEIMEEGNDEQKQEAEALLARIG